MQSGRLGPRPVFFVGLAIPEEERDYYANVPLRDPPALLLDGLESMGFPVEPFSNIRGDDGRTLFISRKTGRTGPVVFAKVRWDNTDRVEAETVSRRPYNCSGVIAPYRRVNGEWSRETVATMVFHGDGGPFIPDYSLLQSGRRR